MSDLRSILKEEYIKKERTITPDNLMAMIERVMSLSLESQEQLQQLNEEEIRFSYSIPFPKLVPTEAWGDPNNMDREQINKIFSVVRGGNSVKGRIQSLNKFLTPESARRKRSPNVILNMMMITEALQATLNDYNESSAGFVFEAFMAALTGGQQIAGRVKGTLPIEDFRAGFTLEDSTLDDPAKAGAPVSLKLLSPKTAIKGSFTNLVDYLLVRGESKIAYLIVYKETTGGTVEKLFVFDFEISRENFVDMLVETGNGPRIFGDTNPEVVKQAFAEWDGARENLLPLAQVMVQVPAYTKAGFLHDFVEKGELPAEEEPEEMSDAEREVELQRQRDEFEKSVHARKIKGMQSKYNESFHIREKRMMAEEQLLMEGAKGDPKSQWSISRSQMDNAAQTINLQAYGTLDLSQKNISELTKIYSDILGDALKRLLETTKELTENIGRYYSESKRARAMNANTKGQAKGNEIVGILEADPKYSKDEK